MKLNDVPLESERKIGVIAMSGRFAPGFSFFSAASFHLVTLPR